MSTHSFHKVQLIPCSLDRAWSFFSDPGNLRVITPSYMGFQIVSGHPPGNMYPGQLIEYKVKPLLGIPIYWMTEITHVAYQNYFVDEQRFGPYRFWHHQHHFKETESGVEMTDIVHWRIPLGFLGDLANTLFVQQQLDEIFNYRFGKVESLFGKVR